MPGLRRGLLLGTLASVAGVVGARRLSEALLTGDRSAPAPGAHTYVFEREQVIDAPLAQVFPFFAQPENLGRITPDWMGFEILQIDNLPMQAGTSMEYRIRLGPLPQRWRTVIVEYEPGRRFVDVQARGPYRWWRHEHTFAEHDGRTVMRDRIEYQLPLGPLGRLAQPVVARQLAAIFAHRERVIAELWPERRLPP